MNNVLDGYGGINPNAQINRENLADINPDDNPANNGQDGDDENVD